MCNCNILQYNFNNIFWYFNSNKYKHVSTRNYQNANQFFLLIFSKTFYSIFIVLLFFLSLCSIANKGMKKFGFFPTFQHCKLNLEYESEDKKLFFFHIPSPTINILKGKSSLRLQYWLSFALWNLLWPSSVSLCLQWGSTDVCIYEHNLYTQAEEWTCHRNLMLWIDEQEKKVPFLELSHSVGLSPVKSKS